MNVYYSLDVSGMDNKLLDIGLVADNGEYFYAEINDYGDVSELIMAEITSKFKFSKDDETHYIRHIHDFNGEGSFSLEMMGTAAEVRENLTLWFEQFGDVHIQLISDDQPYIFYDLQEFFMWRLPENINDCVFDINQMLGISINRNRFNGKAGLAECILAAHQANRDELWEMTKEREDLDYGAVLSLNKANCTRAIYEAFKNLYLAPTTIANVVEKDEEEGETDDNG